MTSEFFNYVIKVKLYDSKPPIWRRLSMPCDTTLRDLHNIIQIAMGWNDSHLHAFTINGKDYSDHSITDIGIDEKTICLNQFMKVGLKFSYEYDFGASWLHEITVEKIVFPQSDERTVICIKGSKAGIEEDFSDEDTSNSSPEFNLVELNKKLEQIQV